MQHFLVGQLVGLGCIVAGSPLVVSVSVSTGAEAATAPFQLRCPILTRYEPCKKECSCSTTGALECEPAAPPLCYEGPRGYQGRYPCGCLDLKLEPNVVDDVGSEMMAEGVDVEVKVKVLPTAVAKGQEGDGPTSTVDAAVWPSMLNCPRTMPLETRKVCYDKCGCVKAMAGKVCLDGTPADCKTQCFCSETALLADEEGGSGSRVQRPLVLAGEGDL